MAFLTKFKPVYLPTNQGHGNARRRSVEECSFDLVALMDSDDISFPDRFARQLELFAYNPELDICGGHITEFVGDENNIVFRREVEITDEAIKKDLKKRCPMNQVTVMFKKSSYDDVGGYLDWYCEEDYYLWTRMVQKGFLFSNVDTDLVNVRVGLGMSARRGGLRYFKSERRMQRYLLSNRLISYPRFLLNVLIRLVGEVVVPNWLRNRLLKFTRKKINPDEKREKIIIDANKKQHPPFSVAMCVYEKDNPEWFDRALNSIINDQTIKPTEVVLVVDGPIPDSIRNIISKYSMLCSVNPK